MKPVGLLLVVAVVFLLIHTTVSVVATQPHYLYVKWYKTSLNVYIKPEYDLQKELVIDAFNVWQWYLNDTIRFAFTDDFSKADVTVIMGSQVHPESNGVFECKDNVLQCALDAELQYDISSKSIVHSDIHIFTSYCTQAKQTVTAGGTESIISCNSMKNLHERDFYYSSLHGVGFVLGLDEKIKNPHDIMFTQSNGQVMDVSKEDISVLLQRYH